MRRKLTRMAPVSLRRFSAEEKIRIVLEAMERAAV